LDYQNVDAGVLDDAPLLAKNEKWGTLFTVCLKYFQKDPCPTD